MSLRIKRAYDPAEASDGIRYLVDRLWPRGVSKERLRLAAWRKDLAPSEELRRRYRHDPVRFAEFRAAYRAELLRRPEALAALRAEGRAGPVTLVFAYREATISNAAVLLELLTEGGELPSAGVRAEAPIGPAPLSRPRRGRPRNRAAAGNRPRGR